jgi:hypothetical protein
MGLIYDSFLYESWFLIGFTWIFFRKSGVWLFSSWRPWRSQDYLRPIGVLLWIIGVAVFLACCVALLFLPVR